MNKKKIICVIFSLVCALSLSLGAVFAILNAGDYQIAQKEYEHALAHYEMSYAAYLADQESYQNEDRSALQQPDGENIVYIDVRGYGIIAVELFPEVAPITVNNFKRLAGEGFYDYLTFHRVIEDFMIQGGCPKGDGTGDADTTIKGEFSANGVENKLLHTKGVISMARSNAYNSASCQFFIVHEDSPHLNGIYAAFGKVKIGMDIVDKIAAVKTDTNDKPVTPIYIRQVALDIDDVCTLKEPTPPEALNVFDFFAFSLVAAPVFVLTLGGAALFGVLFVREERAAKAARLAEAEEARRTVQSAAHAKKKRKKK